MSEWINMKAAHALFNQGHMDVWRNDFLSFWNVFVLVYTSFYIEVKIIDSLKLFFSASGNLFILYFWHLMFICFCFNNNMYATKIVKYIFWNITQKTMIFLWLRSVFRYFSIFLNCDNRIQYLFITNGSRP